eukprot:TRINITY_DN4189_c1_g1_i2.p1 TRINITY_DN4189_c1_g1~~TRINITY_DN4189_c1_g1_i2.p1  ORF type:complete len:138 (-),score=17.95 TRINITY_DN4189_c1_g1_i2:3-416(-)
MVSENGTRKPGVRGYLLITVEEASGRNKDDTFVWDHNSFEGFVKAELRGGERPVKAQTKKVWVQGTSLTWKENLKLEVLEGSNELRLMLCREKMLVKDNNQERNRLQIEIQKRKNGRSESTRLNSSHEFVSRMPSSA